jgi:hypothetical protein
LSRTGCAPTTTLPGASPFVEAHLVRDRGASTATLRRLIAHRVRSYRWHTSRRCGEHPSSPRSGEEEDNPAVRPLPVGTHPVRGRGTSTATLRRHVAHRERSHNNAAGDFAIRGSAPCARPQSLNGIATQAYRALGALLQKKTVAPLGVDAPLPFPSTCQERVRVKGWMLTTNRLPRL